MRMVLQMNVKSGVFVHVFVRKCFGDGFCVESLFYTSYFAQDILCEVRCIH